MTYFNTVMCVSYNQGEQFSGSAGYKALDTCLKEVQRRMQDHLTQGTTG